VSKEIAYRLAEIVDPTRRLGLSHDEFTITVRGTVKGAFKDFATPCIATIQDVSEDAWRQQSELSLYRSMERARLFSQQADVALWQWMQSHPLPFAAADRFVELVRRLRLAFKLQGQFYELEREVDQYTGATGGGLDYALMLLPAALKPEVVSREGSWMDSWSLLRQRVRTAMGHPAKWKMLVRLSALAEVSPEDLVFAANALEFAPGRRGGKTGDVPEDEAIAALSQLDVEPRGIGDLNAKIRFENFLPLVKGGDNFLGKSWRYASVCEVGEMLLDLVIRNPELWRMEFRESFFSEILPQFGFFDATSPKGRMLLEFVQEGKSVMVIPPADEWERQIIGQLYFPSVRTVGKIFPRSEIGGKAFGLAIAKTAGFPILPGSILTMPAIRAGVALGPPCEIPGLDHQGSLVVRSSALDEGSARGVYKTLLAVPRAKVGEAIRNVVRSFSSKKAHDFRRSSGIGDEIDIAAIIQPYQRLKGGVIQSGFVHIGATAAKVTSGCDENVQPGSHELLSAFPDGQIEFQENGAGRTILQLEFGESQRSPRPLFDASTERVEVRVGSSRELASLRPRNGVCFILSMETSLVGFDASLMAWITRHGPRIAELHHPNPPGGGSHLSNLCRHFGITIHRRS
jgi:Pyruvate phosphate dikinase, AMP/ATP-binding domain